MTKKGNIGGDGESRASAATFSPEGKADAPEGYLSDHHCILVTAQCIIDRIPLTAEVCIECIRSHP